MWLCSQLGLLTRSHLMFVSPSGQRAAVCLGSCRSPRLSIVRKNPDTFHIRARCREDLDQLAKAALADNAASLAANEQDKEALELAITTYEALWALSPTAEQRAALETALTTLRSYTF